MEQKGNTLMFTSFDKAIAALVTPIVSLLTLSGVLPESVATPEVVAGITALVTALAVYLIPNKAK